MHNTLSPQQGGLAQSILGEVTRWARRSPSSVAMYAQDEVWTYGELVDQVEHLIHALRVGRVSPGHRIAVIMHDSPILACALVALSSTNPCLPLSATTRIDEIERLLAHAEIDVVVLDGEAHEQFSERLREANYPVFEWSAAGAARCISEVRRGPRAAPVPPGLLMPTSGTSGEPKLVPILGAASVAGAQTISRALSLGPHDRCLNLTPLHHVSGQFMAAFASWMAGASVIVVREPARAGLLAAHAQLRPTWLCAVPATLRRLADDEAGHAGALGLRFIHTGAAALTADNQAAIESAFKTHVIQSYGMTETIMISCNPRSARRVGTVGRAQIPTRVLDARGHEVAAGQEGEICVRGRSVFAGYLGDVSANSQRFVNGWFRTGDLGRVDAEGFLTITGRVKELINRGGEKISPLEVDSVLEAHPAVACAAAFGVPHLALGEEVLAAVELREGHSPSPDELRKFAASHLPPHKVPRRIVLVEAIPKNRVGKKQRYALTQAHGGTAALADEPFDTDEPAVVLDSQQIEELVMRAGVDLTGTATWRSDASFVDQGLDSVGLAELRRTIERALRRPLSATTLFTYPTPRRLAEYLAQAPGRTESVHRGPLDRQVSYTELNWLNVTERTGSCILVEGLHVRGVITESAVRDALRLLQARHPLLQVHVEGSGWSRRFVSVGTREIPLRVLKRHSGEVETELARQINNRHFTRCAPLVEVTLLTMSDRPSEHVLFTRVSHAIWDGGNQFTRELLEMLAVSQGERSKALAPLSAVVSVDELVDVTHRRRRRWGAVLGLLRDLMRRRMPRLQGGDDLRTERISAALDLSIASVIEQAARAEGTTTLGFATAALLRATRAQIDSERPLPLTVMTFVDLRTHYDPPLSSEHLGAHCTALLHSHRLRRNEPLIELARAACRRVARDLAQGLAIEMFGLQRKMFRLSTLFPRLAGPGGRTSTLLVSQVGSFSSIPERMGPIEVLDVLCSGAVHGAGPYANLYVVPYHSGIKLVLVYGAQLAKPNVMRAILDDVVHDLLALASRSSMPS